MSWWVLGIVIVLSLLLVQTMLAARSLAPWVPTRKKDLERILSLVQNQESGVWYELGAGMGSVSEFIASRTKFRVVGIEKSMVVYGMAQLHRSFLSGAGRYRLMWADVYQVNLSDATHLYVFGMPGTLGMKFSEKLRRECQPGTIVISYCFTVEGLGAPEVSKPTAEDFPIYLYKL